ncbi:MAG: hypothetical protein AABM33_14080 [Pseudomonadota bacterium]
MQLVKMPQRQTKCPACRRPIYVKSTPDDRMKRLMTEGQAQAAEAAWARRAFIERVSGVAPALGLFAATVEQTLAGAPNPEAAWEVMVSFRAIEAKPLHERAFACSVLAEIKAQHGDIAALGLLRAAAILRLDKLGESAALVPGIKAEISPGAGANLHDICRAMAAQPPMAIEEELRNPRLPNPACPAARGTLARGFCTCTYVASKADWKLSRSRKPESDSK